MKPKNHGSSGQTGCGGSSMKPKKYIQVQHVAERLDCSKKRVYELIKNGKLEAIRIGPRGIRVAIDELDRFIEQNRIDPEEYFV